MKKFLLLVVITISAVACTKPNFSLDMSIKEGNDFNGHWAYLLAYYDSNVIAWLDSVQICNNRAILKANLPCKEVLCAIIIQDCPVSFNQFRFSQGEKVSFVFDPDIPTAFPPAPGSVSTQEMVDYWAEARADSKELRELNKEQIAVNEKDARHGEITKKIDDLTKRISERKMKLLSDTKSFMNAFTAYVLLREELSNDSLEIIKKDILQRWPDDVNRSMLTGISTTTKDSIREMPLQAKIVLNRRAVLIGDPLPYPAEKIDAEPTDIKQYLLNDTVTDFSLPGISGLDTSMSSCSTPYILIDFWASWCTPCREEVPTIKRAVTEHPELISVYAISIDSNLNQWKNAIEKDGSESFTHVILREDNPHYDKINLLFNIQEIPANFLLDKNHRIIATNLRGEDLTKKLQELSTKSSAETTVK